MSGEDEAAVAAAKNVLVYLDRVDQSVDVTNDAFLDMVTVLRATGIAGGGHPHVGVIDQSITRIVVAVAALKVQQNDLIRRYGGGGL